MARTKPAEKPAMSVVATEDALATPAPGDVALALTLTPDAAEYMVTHLHVRAVHDGFRRCGRAWPAAGAMVSVDEFSEAEVERLLNDPDLMVTPACDPQPPFDGV